MTAFVAVARASGFREAARATNTSASRLSDAVRRLESRLGVRLFHRSTRSVVVTEAGASLLERVSPVMNELDSALDSVNHYRGKPAGKLRLHVPVSAAKLILPAIVPPFLAAYPDIELEVVADSNVINVFEAGCDAGIRYDERLEQDMIAVPIGPRRQRFATAAAPALLDRLGRPEHPRDLLEYPCIGGRYRSGVASAWEFEKDGQVIEIQPAGPLTVSVGSAVDLAVDAAVAGTGVITLFEQWLRPYLDCGQLEPVLESWWQSFSGPYLYYSGRRLAPTPLLAFIDFLRKMEAE
nr:LysR substrate-binding domain-containing protein [Microbulbifer sp. GX H0434]